MKVMSVSVEEDLYRALKAVAGPRGMSRFIAEAVRDKLSESRRALEAEYAEAAGDRRRQEELADWDAIAGEGWK